MPKKGESDKVALHHFILDRALMQFRCEWCSGVMNNCPEECPESQNVVTLNRKKAREQMEIDQ
jgi:hypothetical protein